MRQVVYCGARQPSQIDWSALVDGTILLFLLALFAQGVGFVLYLLPEFVGDRHKGIDDVRVELVSRVALDFAASRGDRLRRAVRPIGYDGIEGVRNSEDARPDRDLIAFEAAWITAAVIPLLMAV